eukprot:m51a1_g7485 hypothetical protein (197) ;mRNA; r:221410-222000
MEDDACGPIEIRVATPGLFDDCTALVHQDEWDNFASSDWARCHSLTHGGGVFCALCGGSVVGLCATERPCDEYAWLSVMFVSKRFRSRGVGSLLFDRAAAYATSCGASMLGCDCASPAVQRMLTRRFGMHCVHEDCETQYRWCEDLDEVIAALPSGDQGIESRVFELDLDGPDFARAVEIDRTVTGFDKSRVRSLK